MPIAAEFVTTASIYQRNEAMLAKEIDELNAEQWTSRPLETSNSALWILGHIVWARSRGLKLLGVDWTAPWLKYFERGSKPEDSVNYPPCGEVIAAWKELMEKLPVALASSSPEAMAAPASQPSPSLDGTIGGMMSFLAMHETYHIGQMAYVRRLLRHDEVGG
jgi:uncharacterized damage-inducible protein DinB